MEQLEQVEQVKAPLRSIAQFAQLARFSVLRPLVFILAFRSSQLQGLA
jgi:hypothetical protein